MLLMTVVVVVLVGVALLKSGKLCMSF
jgi:hypothetical protein